MAFKLIVAVLFGLLISRFVLSVEARVAVLERNSSIPASKKLIGKPLGRNFINGGVEFAGIIVNIRGLTGASADIAIEKPSASSGQWTTASIILEADNGDQLEAGWMVNPDLYSDGEPRLYTKWKSANSPGCYNSDCPGFVSMNPDIPLGYVFPDVSKITGERYEVKIIITKVQEHWFLEMNENAVGSWRGSIFGSLSQSASTARFGGQAFSPDGVGPKMGTGMFKNDNPIPTAYMHNVQVLDGSFVDPPSYTVAESRCYLVGFLHYGLLKGFKFLFGGKGGKPDSCLG